ncbi:alcohol dehydrogenase catalytic domain-containing protein [Candidatus Bathyarchaeota archaeon]|nr:alcohol dehydrogenase catalytic domain-containing protein [Candidatus Bathyarchaeota archaeon]MBS7628970.1 alcohol dehydrogenase catalytic domain-containing protein [Candidatus Bathyarchaeota archaeon]
MKAARFYEVGKPLKIENVDIPRISDSEVLVRVRSCGICHTDLHFIDEGLIKPGKVPQIMGHEAAGDVVEVGERVKDVKVGDRVLIHFYFSCGECYYCRRGRESLCVSPEFQHFGFTTDGGYAEYAKAPARSIIKLPSQLPYDAGILVDAGSTAYHAVREIGKVRLGDFVVIIGSGGVGLCTLQMAKLSGATVMAVDISSDKLDAAKSLGADHVANPTVDNLYEEVRRLTDGRGADVIFELVGLSETMGRAVDILAKGGRLVFIGYSKDDLTINPRRLVTGELQIVGSRASSRYETVEVVNLVRDGRFKLDPLITHRVSLDEVNEGLDLVRRGESIRVVVRP